MVSWLDLDSLVFTEVSDGVAVARLDFNACEADVYRYLKETRIDFHTHSDDTLKVLLRGEMLLDGEKPGHIGALYPCKAQEGYWSLIKSGSYVLQLQKPGTKRVMKES